MASKPTVYAVIEAFREAMRAEGISYDGELFADGEFRRIHADGDRRGTKNSWYKLFYDERPAGKFGCNKRTEKEGIAWQYHSEPQEFTPEERAAFAAKKKADEKRKAAEKKKRHAAARITANRLWADSVPVSEHEYLQKKSVHSYGLRIGAWEMWDKEAGQHYVISDQALLIPLHDTEGELHSLQAILPEACLTEDFAESKRYLANGDKEGHFHTIGTRPLEVNGKPVMVLVEGYATGATIHEATGHMVLVCFDAGNLLHVAKAVAKAWPDNQLLFAADNDQFTEKPIKNPGITRAREAAKAVSGLVVWPEFEEAWLESRPTDFNDLAQLDSLSAVKATIEAAFAPAKEKSEPREILSGTETLANNRHFRMIGFTDNHFYCFIKGDQTVLPVKRTLISEGVLLNLAPSHFWRELAPNEKGDGFNKLDCFNDLIQTARHIPFYEEDTMRGLGAWFDGDHFVLHHGDRLTIDGQSVELQFQNLQNIYPRRRKLPALPETDLDKETRQHIQDIAAGFRWVNPVSSLLLTGWCFLAPICGALSWRPHLWITGGAGCGKSTIMEHFVMVMLKEIALFAQGNSTEAGLRQKLGFDSLPVLREESESNTQAENEKMEMLLMLMRQASSDTDAKTFKGSSGGQAMSYLIRSMFALCSINTMLNKKADIDRIARLELHKVDPADRDRVQAELAWLKTVVDLPGKMFRRALNMSKTIAEAINRFKRRGNIYFKSPRMADQYGTLAAGYWCFNHDVLPTDAQIDEIYTGYDWANFQAADEDSDPQQALDKVLTSHIDAGNRDRRAIFDLICIAAKKDVVTRQYQDAIKPKEAFKILKEYGIIVHTKDRRVYFAPTHPKLQELVRNTSFSNDLRGQLSRLDDAITAQSMKFFSHSSRPIGILLDPLLAQQDEEDEDRPI